MNTTTKPRSLYQKREKVQVRPIRGTYQWLRKLTIWITLSWFFSGPWLTWQGQQAIWFDIAHRKFYLFSLTFWPQDLIFLVGMLCLAAMTLFFITTLFGRVWCGYTCPQTVWTKLFMAIEAWCEGTRSQRIKLDRAPLSVEKIIRRMTKHGLWLLLAFFTAFTFVGYFSPIHHLLFDLTQAEASLPVVLALVFFTGMTYLNAGWMREQVCFYMCPYAKFQSVMFDNDTLVIAYDSQRGEPRGGKRYQRGQAFIPDSKLGDCIDCGLCVEVCPTGIDIRNGLQMECIACASCVDACNHVMKKMGAPPDLISYTTEHRLQSNQPFRWLRLRVIGYGVVGLSVFLLLVMGLWQRTPIDLDVIRERSHLFRETVHGEIENIYALKIMNKSQSTQHYHIEMSGFDGLKMVGATHIVVPAGDLVTVPVRLQAPIEQIKNARESVTFYVINKQQADSCVREKSVFIYKQPS